MLKTFSVTDIGRKRKMNKDYVYSSEQPIGHLPNLFLVADGMGGHNAGEYASKVTVETIVEYIADSPETDAARIFDGAIHSANARIRRLAAASSLLAGMGTTVVAATCEGDRLSVANVGDSRLYIVGRRGIRQITRDHSFVEELVALGKIKRDSRDYQKNKNIITRAIGTMKTVDTDLFALKLKPKDTILMCSDGLSNMVDEFEMEYIIRTEEGIRRKTEILVEAANRSGGRDNISVILIEPQIREVTL